MKILEENVSLSPYIEQLRLAINSETESIAVYDSILANSGISESIKQIINEINDDEKDHLVILSQLLYDEVEEAFPEYGDADLEIENEEEK